MLQNTYFVIILLLVFFVPISFMTGISVGKQQSENFVPYTTADKSCCKYLFGPKYYAFAGYPSDSTFDNMAPYTTGKNLQW